jgi:hypothetical protein
MENLVKIQNELKVPKQNVNAFGKYKYRSAEDILEAVKPILLKYNATLTLSDTIVSIGSKYFMCAEAELSIKEQVKVLHGYAELAEHKGMSAEQATGTASSYARKYALNGLFLIDETESDADSQKPIVTPSQLTVDLEEVKSKLIVVGTLEQLRVAYTSLTKLEQSNPDVIAFKDKLKATLK